MAEYCKTLNLPIIPPPIRHVRLANQEVVQAEEGFTVELRIMNQTINGTLTRLPGLVTDMVIGVDLMKKYKMRIDLATNKMTIDNGPTICMMSIAEGVTDKPTLDLRKEPLCLTPQEETKLSHFLNTELPRFNQVRGVTPLTRHKIHLENSNPIKQRYRPQNPRMQEIINTEVNKMLEEDIIEPSNSPWSSPVVIVRKKDGKYRFCIDFQKVNAITKKDAYPLPFINAILDKLRRAKYISSLDLKQGYWQIGLTEESKR